MNTLLILKTALRSLRSDPKNTLINIAGLCGGLTVFMLIVVYVNSQYAYNTHIPHAEELFRLERGFHGITNAVEAVPLASGIPEISGYCRIATQHGTLFHRPGNATALKRAKIKGIAADSSFTEIFAIEITERSAKAPLSSPASILISRDLAEILFGKGQATGEIVSFEGRQDLVVEGVFEPLPSTSTLDFNAIFSLEYFAMESGDQNYLDNRGMWRYETFFRLDPGHRETVIEKVHDQLHILYGDPEYVNFRENIDVGLRPLKDIYFAGVTGYHKLGDRKNTYIFMIIAGFVLLIAAINFINLSTAQQARRSKEIGLRKILGSGRPSLIGQVCAEGAFTILISVALALAICELLLPWYSGFVNTRLAIEYSALNLLLMIIVAPLLLGTLSALFPAFYLSRVTPVSVIRREWVSGKGGARLRTFLTIFQFSISIFLIAGTLVVNRQLRFISSYDPGYTTDNIIEVTLNDQVKERFDVFKQACLSYPSVTGVTRTNQAFYQAGNVWSVFHDDKNFTWPYIMVDEDFVEFFGLDIKTGGGFSVDLLKREKTVFLVNEAVVSAFETADILNETINDHQIVGVVNNFHTASLKSDIRPVTIGLSPQNAGSFVYFSFDPRNQRESIDFIRGVWDEHSPDYPLEYEFLADRIESAYSSEKRFGELFTYFSLVSILISCLGLFALASFTAENRVKEISIRKVHGATTLGIGILLSSGLTGKIIIANLLAWPAAWYFTRGWLENFVYRASPGMWEFLLAALIAQIIALATVSWNVYATARKNPSETLKYE